MQRQAGSVDRGLSARSRRLVMVAEVVPRLVLVVLVPHLLSHIFDGDAHHYVKVAHLVDFSRSRRGHGLPYREVFWEYPPLTVPVLFLAKVSAPLARFRVVLGVVMVGFELSCLHVLRRAWPERWRPLTVAWNVTVVPIALLAWFRLDFVGVLFASTALVAVARKAKGGAGSIVAGFATKLWPIVLVAPLVMRRRGNDAVKAIVGCAAVLVAWYVWSPHGVRRFFAYRSSSALEVESLLGGFDLFGHHRPLRVVSGTWALSGAGGTWAQPVLYLALAVVVAACFWRARGATTDMVAFAGALTVAAMLFSWILSPQYLVWVAPFVVVMAALGHRRVAWWYGAATLVTLVMLLGFLHWYAVRGAVTTSAFAATLVVVRNGLLIGLLVEMIVAIRPRPGWAGEVVSPTREPSRQER